MAVRFWHGWRAAGACGRSPKQMADEEKVEQTPDRPNTPCWWRVQFGLVTGGGNPSERAVARVISCCGAQSLGLRQTEQMLGRVREVNEGHALASHHVRELSNKNSSREV